MTAPRSESGGQQQAAAEVPREEFARWFAWAYGGEEYADSGQSAQHWLDVTDEFLAEPFMRRLLAEATRPGQELRARVEALAAGLEQNARDCRVGERKRIYNYAAKRLRAALEDPR